MMCLLILCMSGGNYSLKSTPNDRFFKKIFMAILICSQSFLPENCREEISKEILLVFYFGFMSNKPIHYLLDYGDFILLSIPTKSWRKFKNFVTNFSNKRQILYSSQMPTWKIYRISPFHHCIEFTICKCIEALCSMWIAYKHNTTTGISYKYKSSIW